MLRKRLTAVPLRFATRYCRIKRGTFNLIDALSRQAHIAATAPHLTFRGLE